MSTDSRNTRRRVLMLCALVAMAPVVALAQSTTPPPPVQDNAWRPGASSPNEAKRPSHWLQNLTKLVTPQSKTKPYERENPSVMVAFREVVGRPAKSTVRVYCDFECVALGTIVSRNGMVLTKGSELRNEAGQLKGRLVCELADSSRYNARLVATDQQTDLALLQLPTQGLPAIEWSEKSSPATGSWVVTPGLGDDPEAIGVVSVAAHAVRGGVLGIFLEDMEGGVRVWRVIPGSGAAKAGVVNNDFITHINGKTVSNRDGLVATINVIPPGENVQLTLVRNGKRMLVEAQLSSVTDTFGSQRSLFQNALGSDLSSRKEAFPSVFEHDSVLEPNDCGGPIVDLEGKALGINIARASRVSSYALPAHVVRCAISAMSSSPDTLATISHQDQAARAGDAR